MTRAIVDIAAPHISARSHHRRQERACEPEGIEADVTVVHASSQRRRSMRGAAKL
jgi:hypothetical protein